MKIDVIYNKSSQRMDELPDKSVDCILTSCPYWGLRDYGEDVREIWGGDGNCKHQWTEAGGGLLHENRNFITGTQEEARGKTGTAHIFKYDKIKSGFCQLCGAWYGQLGLEPTLEMYIEHLLLITLECKRVLKPTGVMWWNHGDSYFTGKGSCRNPGGGNKSWKSWNDRKGIYPRGRAAPNRMSKESPPKCLALQNYRLVIRMIDEQGWILRNDAIWNKPNGMPSSVKDRLANKYEPIFCFVKNTKPQYYWNEKTGLMTDRKPPKDKQKEGTDWDYQTVGIVNENTFNVRVRDGDTERFLQGATDEEKKKYGEPKLKKRTYWHSLGYWFDLDAIREEHKYLEIEKRRKDFGDKVHYGGQQIQMRGKNRYGRSRAEDFNPSGKNPGDVWIIPTQPRPEAHFATFPDKLCIKPILATCPAEICKKCGKARVRITNTDYIPQGKKSDKEKYKSMAVLDAAERDFQAPQGMKYGRANAIRNTIGWTDCGCNAGWDSGILLDPFTGRGTALIMAKKLGRHYIGYELKKEYCEKLIKPTLEEIDPLFNWKTPSPVAG